MTFLAPMWWLFSPLSIFTSFDFASPEDFCPLATLILGLGVVFLMRRRSPEPASPVLMGMMLLLSLWPVLPNLGLFLMAREFQAVNGSWPQVMIDDPKNQLGHTSLRYDNLFSVVVYLEAFAGAWMVLFFALLLRLRGRFSALQWRMIVQACLGSMLWFILDPGALYSWWLD